MRLFYFLLFGVIVLSLLSFNPVIIRHDTDATKYLEFAQNPIFQSVGAIYYDKKPYASCVLITENIILTDAHVFEDGNIMTDYLVKFNDQELKVKNLIIHPKYEKSNIDLAVVTLEKAVEGIKPAKLYKGREELGEIVYFAGFGAFYYAEKNESKLWLKAAGTNVIDQIGGMVDSISYKSHELLIDFDSPLSTECNLLGNSNPLELEMIPTGGDSGGGLFIKKDNDYFLAGLYVSTGFYVSFRKETITVGDSTFTINVGVKWSKCDYDAYGKTASFTRISEFQNWIERTIKKIQK